MSEKYLKYGGLLVLGIMFSGVLAVAVSEVHSFDVFWQLQSGKYMWETGNFIRTDLFTLAPETPRYEHAWLHDLILFWVYQFSGYDGISVLKGLLIFLTAGTLVATARSRAASWLAIAAVFPIFILTGGGWLERPQLWTFLMFALFVLILEVACRRNSWWILLLFPLGVVWANLHAGSVLAIALIVAYLVGSLIDSAVARKFSLSLMAKLGGILVLTCAAAFLTPYPEKLLNTLVKSPKLGASVDKAGQVTGKTTAVFNMDWTPTTFQMEPVFFYAMGLTALIMLLGWRRLKATDICLMLGLGFMGLKLVRHIPFFYMGMIVILPVYLEAAARPVITRLSMTARMAGGFACMGLALWGFYFLWQPAYHTYGLFHTGLRTWHYPIEATEFIEEHNLPKNLYNTYDWGGYLAWKLYPEYQVFWDGRQTSKRMFDLGWSVMAGQPDWQKILDQFDVKTIVHKSTTMDTGQKYPVLDRLRESPDWFLVFNDESSMVFVKRGAMPREWMQKYVRPKYLMDDTILSEAILSIKVHPQRYIAWWEMAQIYLKRKEYRLAYLALQQHLNRAPRPMPQAEQLYRQLGQHLQGQAFQ